MNNKLVLVCLFAFVVYATATVYFEEKFHNGKSNWVESTFKGADAGRFELTPGTYFKDEKEDIGLKTGEDYRFYQISAKFNEFSNKGEVLVFQFSIKHEQKLDCGGGYVKLLPPGINQKNFNGDSDYNIMFGPDICGGTKRVHVILNYKGQNYLINKQISPETDVFTHVYTLTINPDQTYSVKIDNDEVAAGHIFEDWTILPPKQIKDPKISKPADWVDLKEIADPSAVKPAGWDDIPEFIEDPEAALPEDWDAELDGEWERPIIPNPDYQGEWKAPKIPNPAYKGPWEHPLIDNPDYFEDKEIYAYTHSFVGIEIWQVKAGSIFDNFLVTNDVALASKEAEELVGRSKVEEEKEKAVQEEARAKEAEERARLEAEFGGDDDEDDDDHVHDEL